jgi:hypothetical protein
VLNPLPRDLTNYHYVLANKLEPKEVRSCETAKLSLQNDYLAKLALTQKDEKTILDSSCGTILNARRLSRKSTLNQGELLEKLLLTKLIILQDLLVNSMDNLAETS